MVNFKRLKDCFLDPIIFIANVARIFIQDNSVLFFEDYHPVRKPMEHR